MGHRGQPGRKLPRGFHMRPPLYIRCIHRGGGCPACDDLDCPLRVGGYDAAEQKEKENNEQGEQNEHI